MRKNGVMGEMNTSERQILERATALMSRKELAECLRVPKAVLDAWVQGEGAIPSGKLLMLAVILDKLAGGKQ
jgi:DNA-binding transcriptional regulator YiaG